MSFLNDLSKKIKYFVEPEYKESDVLDTIRAIADVLVYETENGRDSEIVIDGLHKINNIRITNCATCKNNRYQPEDHFGKKVCSTTEKEIKRIIDAAKIKRNSEITDCATKLLDELAKHKKSHDKDQVDGGTRQATG